MNHDSEDRRFYTYLHKNTDGNVVYVGNGSDRRWKRNTGRTKEHIEIFDSLTKEIVESGLTKQESVEKEIELYNRYVSTGLLINKRPPNKVSEIDWELLSEYFAYDESSPTFLTRLKSITAGKNNFPKYKAGTPAGNISSSGYGTLCFQGKGYSLHRVIWAVFHKKNLPTNLVIDHIDNNPSNNKIDNLRPVAVFENSINRKDFCETTNISFVDNRMWNLQLVRKGSRICRNFVATVLFPEDDFQTAKEKSKELAMHYRDAHISSPKDFQTISEIDNLIEEMKELSDNKANPFNAKYITYEVSAKRFRVAIAKKSIGRICKNFHISTYGSYDKALEAAKSCRDKLLVEIKG